MAGSVLRLLIVSAALIIGGARAAPENWSVNAELDQSLEASFQGGAVKVASDGPLDRMKCMGRNLAFVVQTDDAAFFTAGSADLEAMADSIGASVMSACEGLSRGRSARFEIRRLNPAGAVLAKAWWASFSNSQNGQITAFEETGKARVQLPPESVEWFNPQFIEQHYPALGVNAARSLRDQSGMTVPQLAGVLAALPEGQVARAFEVSHRAARFYSACAWFDEMQFSTTRVREPLITLKTLVILDASANGRPGPYLADVAAAPEEQAPSRTTGRWNTAMQDWINGLDLAVMNANPYDNGMCADNDIATQGKQAVKILVSSDGGAVLEAVTSGTFDSFPALAAFLGD